MISFSQDALDAANREAERKIRFALEGSGTWRESGGAGILRARVAVHRRRSRRVRGQCARRVAVVGDGVKRSIALAIMLLASLPPTAPIVIERPVKCPHCEAVCFRADSLTWFCGVCKVPVDARPA